MRKRSTFSKGESQMLAQELSSVQRAAREICRASRQLDQVWRLHGRRGQKSPFFASPPSTESRCGLGRQGVQSINTSRARSREELEAEWHGGAECKATSSHISRNRTCTRRLLTDCQECEFKQPWRARLGSHVRRATLSLHPEDDRVNGTSLVCFHPIYSAEARGGTRRLFEASPGVRSPGKCWRRQVMAWRVDWWDGSRVEADAVSSLAAWKKRRE